MLDIPREELFMVFVKKSKKISPLQILLFVLLFSFGIFAVYLFSSKNGLSLDFRSKAGTIETVIKSWDFATDGNTEGWNATNMTGLTTKAGFLDGNVKFVSGISTNLKIPTIANTNLALSTKENVRYAFGDKKIKIRMAVTAQLYCGIPPGLMIKGTPMPTKQCTPLNFPFEVSIITPLRGTPFEKTIQQVTGDGVIREYEFVIPQSIPLTSITGISIYFTGLSKYDAFVHIDSIQIVARQFVKPTPKPPTSAPKPTSITAIPTKAPTAVPIQCSQAGESCADPHTCCAGYDCNASFKCEMKKVPPTRKPTPIKKPGTRTIQ